MFHSSVVVDVSLSPVSIPSATVPYCIMPTITSVHVVVEVYVPHSDIIPEI